MSFQNLNISPTENKFIFSTPKFSQALLDKESFNKNSNSLGLDIPSFEEPKLAIIKRIKNKESKEINNNINSFKENFSLSSLLNEKNNDEININENNQNANEEKKINIININIENPSKKNGKIKKALISFGDKSENENNSLNNNEIIYREKENNSSIISNKDKEKEKEKEENNEIQNNNINNSIEKKDSNNIQNISNSFQYNLPLENDKTPNACDFFAFDENDNLNNDNNANKDKNNLNDDNKEEKKDIILDNNPINNHTIETDRNNLDTNKINSKNNFNLKIAYSKKKVKRSKTERQSMSHKLLLNEDIVQKINEQNNEYTNKNYPQNNKNDILLSSYENNKKFKKKIKYCSIDISLEENEEKTNDIFLSGKNERFTQNFPQKKLTIIKKLKLFNLPKVKEDNMYQIKNYSSRENFQKNNKNNDVNLKNILKVKNNNNKNIKSDIKLNSFNTQKKFKNLKFTKYPNLFSDFQRFKRFHDIENIDSINTVRESINSNNIINSNIVNIANNNNTVVEQNKNSKNVEIKNKISRGIENYNDKNNFKTRNFDNIIFNNSHKIFNNAFYNTINYEDHELNTIKTASKNINITNKKILNNKIKAKAPIKNSVTEFKDFKLNKKKSNRFNNNKNSSGQQNNNYIRNKNINSKNKFENQTQFKMNLNKIKIENNSNKSKNLVFNNHHLTKNKPRQKKFYNKFIYNVFETNPNNNNNNDNTQTKNQISRNQNNEINNEKIIDNNRIKERNNFINDNSSTNSLQSNENNKIKVHMIFNKHTKLSTSPNLFSQDRNSKKYWKIYKKPKNTCLFNHFNNEDNSINNKKNISKKNLNYSKKELSEVNSGYKSNKNSQIIALRKRFINSTNLTVRNSISKFEQKPNESDLNNQRSSMQKLNLNMDKFYLNMKNSQTIDDYNEDIIKYSIMRNNLNNQVINEFSLTVGDSNNQDKKAEIKNEINNKKRININKKKINNKKEGINDKKTIINVNQYYPSYFINAQNQNFKEKK